MKIILIRKFVCKKKLLNDWGSKKNLIWKLDWVGPVDNSNPTEYLQRFVQKREKKVTYDRWHMTCDIWHMTCDTWHMTGEGKWTFSQTVSSLALTVWEWRFVEDILTSHDYLNELINDEGVYRTALATLGLLIIYETNKTVTKYSGIKSFVFGFGIRVSEAWINCVKLCMGSLDTSLLHCISFP